VERLAYARHNLSPAIRFTTVALTLLLAGCSPSAAPSEPSIVDPASSPRAGASPSAAASESSIVDPAASSQGGASPSAAPSVDAGSAAASTISVRTDKPSYAEGEAIPVTIQNRDDRSVFALSGKTYCTIVSAQRNEAAGWQEQGRCVEGAPPGYVEILPGQTRTFDLAPTRGEEPLPAGKYRIELTVAIGSTDGTTATVYSSGITIGS